MFKFSLRKSNVEYSLTNYVSWLPSITCPAADATTPFFIMGRGDGGEYFVLVLVCAIFSGRHFNRFYLGGIAKYF